MKRIEDAEVKKLELNILLQFRDYCKKYGLRYFLAYGTLLGAIRHKGFIPWDNDIDVFMPRPDYEKLIEKCKETRIGEYITLLDYHNKNAYPFVKLVDNRTRLKEYFLVSEDDMGIFIDIFPLDGMPDSGKKSRILYRKAAVLYKLYALATYRKNTGANWYKKLLKKIVWPLRCFVSAQSVNQRLNRLCQDYEYDTSEYVGNIVWGEKASEEITPRSYYKDAELEFEDRLFCVPSEYDKLLTQQYGDYMTLPPEEDRFVHVFDAEWK